MISIFDVIGPNMIGPSSSHTAGALRIALLAKQIAKDEIESVEFVLFGSFAKTYKGHGTDRALVGGILGFNTDDHRIKNSFDHAHAANIAYKFTISQSDDFEHPNTVQVIIKTKKGETVDVVGVSVGGGCAEIHRIDGVEVKLSGQYYTLFVRQHDRPGVVAHITKVLSDFGVNVAFMNLYRENKSETAYTIIETDDPITPEMLEKINENKNIQTAKIINT